MKTNGLKRKHRPRTERGVRTLLDGIDAHNEAIERDTAPIDEACRQALAYLDGERSHREPSRPTLAAVLERARRLVTLAEDRKLKLARQLLDPKHKRELHALFNATLHKRLLAYRNAWVQATPVSDKEHRWLEGIDHAMRPVLRAAVGDGAPARKNPWRALEAMKRWPPYTAWDVIEEFGDTLRRLEDEIPPLRPDDAFSAEEVMLAAFVRNPDATLAKIAVAGGLSERHLRRLLKGGEMRVLAARLKQRKMDRGRAPRFVPLGQDPESRPSDDASSDVAAGE